MVPHPEYSYRLRPVCVYMAPYCRGGFKDWLWLWADSVSNEGAQVGYLRAACHESKKPDKGPRPQRRKIIPKQLPEVQSTQYLRLCFQKNIPVP